MRSKKIFPIDWMQWHPYKQVTSVDIYYTEIANRIYKILNQIYFAKDPFGEEENMKKAACCMAAYFEDVISQIGIWKAFTEECKKLYGKYLPFYWLTDRHYFNDEINAEDIRFLLWHHTQQTRDASIVNPENPTIELVAQQIYELLESEYETAPENEKMQDCFSRDKRYDSFTEYRELLEWFHYHSYLQAFNLEEMVDELESLFEEYGDKQYSRETYQILMYTVKSNLCFTSRKNLLSFTSPEWLSIIYGADYQQATHFSEVKQKESAHYLYNEQDERWIYATDLETQETFHIEKSSFQKTDNLIANQSTFTCVLVYYAGAWNQVGGLALYTAEERAVLELELEKEKLRKQKNEELYTLFMQENKGVPFAFFKSHEEHLHFITHTLGMELPDKAYTLPKDSPQQGVIIASPEEGLYIQGEGLACIKSPLNPFYNSITAEKEAFSFYANPDFCSFEFACYLHEHRLLPDAGLKSLKGIAYGQKFLEENWDFIVRYFLQKSPEKDYFKQTYSTNPMQ